MKQDLGTMLNKIQKQYEDLNEDCHKLDNRVVKLEESMKFIKDDLKTIKKNSEDVKEKLDEITKGFFEHKGASETRKSIRKILYGGAMLLLGFLGNDFIMKKFFGG